MGFFRDDVEDVSRFIHEEWLPANYNWEKGYEDELVADLRERFPRWRVHPQYRVGFTSVDIALIEPNIAIELKYDLTDVSEYFRLMGQILYYRRDFRHVIVVACGEVRPELRDDLLEFMDWLNREHGGHDRSVHYLEAQ